MSLLITFSEQQNIKPISPNSEPRFAQIMKETQINELQELLGFQLYQDLIQNPTSTNNNLLLNGAIWEYCGQKIKMHGLKYVLAHYFYSNYSRENKNHDTYSGQMIHQIAEAQHVSIQELNGIKKRARETASKFWQEVKLFLDNNTNSYPYWFCDKKRKGVFKPKISRLSRPVTNSEYEYMLSKRHTTCITTPTPPTVIGVTADSTDVTADSTNVDASGGSI